jgi:hypothetical protein
METWGLSYARTDQVLTPSDYQAVWRRSLATVCRVLEENRRCGSAGGILWSVVCAYPLYFASVQQGVLETFFEKLHQRCSFRTIRLEEIDSTEENDTLVFSGLHSSCYTWAARHWAHKKGVAVQWRRATASAREDERATRRGFRERFIAFAWDLRNMGRSLLDGVVLGLKLTRVLLRPSARAILYRPSRQSGLPRWAPADFINVEPLLLLGKILGRIVPCRGGEPSVLKGMDSVVGGTLSPEMADRVRSYMNCRARKHGPVISLFSWIADVGAKLSRRVAWVSASPFASAEPVGWAAEAIRSRSFPVGGVQHGANYRLCRRGAVPFRLWDGLGGLFFQWGRGDADESGEGNGLPPLRAHRTGSPWMKSLADSARRRPTGRPPTVLYCPTLLNIETVGGMNIPWDRYYTLLNNVLGILQEAPFAVTVKPLPSREMQYIDWKRYPRLNIARSGTFWRMMGRYDVLIIDGLQGSPIYEAMASRSSILLYEGVENGEWDDGFLQALRRRAVCCSSEPSYIESIRSFVSAGDAFFTARGVSVNSEVLDTYLTPVDQTRFWDSLRAGLFSPREGLRGG